MANDFETERLRAIEYRRKENAKEVDRLARERAMQGNDEEYQALLARQSTVKEWLGWSPEKLVQGDAK